MSNSPFVCFFANNTLYAFVVYTKSLNTRKYYLSEVYLQTKQGL